MPFCSSYTETLALPQRTAQDRAYEGKKKTNHKRKLAAAEAKHMCHPPTCRLEAVPPPTAGLPARLHAAHLPQSLGRSFSSSPVNNATPVCFPRLRRMITGSVAPRCALCTPTPGERQPLRPCLSPRPHPDSPCSPLAPSPPSPSPLTWPPQQPFALRSDTPGPATPCPPSPSQCPCSCPTPLINVFDPSLINTGLPMPPPPRRVQRSHPTPFSAPGAALPPGNTPAFTPPPPPLKADTGLPPPPPTPSTAVTSCTHPRGVSSSGLTQVSPLSPQPISAQDPAAPRYIGGKGEGREDGAAPSPCRYRYRCRCCCPPRPARLPPTFRAEGSGSGPGLPAGAQRACAGPLRRPISDGAPRSLPGKTGREEASRGGLQLPACPARGRTPGFSSRRRRGLQLPWCPAPTAGYRPAPRAGLPLPAEGSLA